MSMMGTRWPAWTDKGVQLDGNSNAVFKVIEEDGRPVSSQLQTGYNFMDESVVKTKFNDEHLQWQIGKLKEDKYTKKYGKSWITIFPDKPITKKPAETRMGSGKGNPEYFVAVVKPGRVMFEIAGLSEAESREVLKKAIQKLPIKCKVISKEESLGGNDSEK